MENLCTLPTLYKLQTGINQPVLIWYQPPGLWLAKLKQVSRPVKKGQTSVDLKKKEKG